MQMSEMRSRMASPCVSHPTSCRWLLAFRTERLVCLGSMATCGGIQPQSSVSAYSETLTVCSQELGMAASEHGHECASHAGIYVHPYTFCKAHMFALAVQGISYCDPCFVLPTDTRAPWEVQQSSLDPCAAHGHKAIGCWMLGLCSVRLFLSGQR